MVSRQGTANARVPQLTSVGQRAPIVGLVDMPIAILAALWHGTPSLIEQVTRAHREAGWRDRLFVASKPATSGVLQGLRHFLGDASVASS